MHTEKVDELIDTLYSYVTESANNRGYNTDYAVVEGTKALAELIAVRAMMEE